jgi:hypothetical protein
MLTDCVVVKKRKDVAGVVFASTVSQRVTNGNLECRVLQQHFEPIQSGKSLYTVQKI